MELSHTHHFKRSVLFSLLGVLFLGVTALYISGTLQSITTAIVKPNASALQPTITQGITEAFNKSVIDTSLWQVSKSPVVTMAETPNDNLRITVPAGMTNNAANLGKLVFKQPMKDLGDFQINVVILRPIVTGTGKGISGIRFLTTSNYNDEKVSLRWIVQGTTSQVWFTVFAANGTVLLSKHADLNSNIAVFRLARINTTYRGSYNVGNDTTADATIHVLGEVTNPGLGDDGKVELFALNNDGTTALYPGVVAIFDTAFVGWQGKPATSFTFNDAFANGVIAKEWNPVISTGSVITETAANNLNMTVPAGMVANKPGKGSAVRTNPVVPKGKDFSVNAEMFKPTVTGAGWGAAGINFQSAVNTNDEAARVFWATSGASSVLIFSVLAPNGAMLDRAQVNAPGTKLTIRLARTGNKYAAFYRTGDNDTPWITIGQAADDSLGANGKFALFTTNTGTQGKYPKVVGRFDFVNGDVSK